MLRSISLFNPILTAALGKIADNDAVRQFGTLDGGKVLLDAPVLRAHSEHGLRLHKFDEAFKITVKVMKTCDTV